MKISQIFSRNVREIMKKKSMTNAELAEKLNFSKQYVGMLLNEERAISANIIRRTANVLDVEVDELLLKQDQDNQMFEFFLSGDFTSVPARHMMKKIEVMMNNYIALDAYDKKQGILNDEK